MSLPQSPGMEYKFTWLEGPTILVVPTVVNTPFRIDLFRDTDAMEIDSDSPSTDHLMEDSESVSR